MTPAARLAATIEILGLLAETSQPADRLMQAYFRARRFAGGGDRRAIAERVYAVFRARAHLAWRMGGDAPRLLAIGALLAEGARPEDFFTGGYGPGPLSDTERAAIAAEPGQAPLWVQGEFPPFLETELRRAFGAALLAEMEAFQARAPVDLRVNILKATRDDVLARLRGDGFNCEAIPGPASPACEALAGEVVVAGPRASEDRRGLRCPPGVNLTAHPLYQAGAFEIQDAAAQYAVRLAAARPGQRVLDLAAGAGGKSLGLAAEMENRGEIVACDIRGPALAELERRAARAGVTIIRTHLLGSPPPGPFDLVFLDAPCSGSGTWRRQPEAKWRLTPARLAELMGLQDRLLDQAAGLVAEGGRLIYATCSVLPCENEDRLAAFQARHPGLVHLPNDFKASPAATGTDGFYAAVLVKTGHI